MIRPEDLPRDLPKQRRTDFLLTLFKHAPDKDAVSRDITSLGRSNRARRMHRNSPLMKRVKRAAGIGTGKERLSGTRIYLALLEAKPAVLGREDLRELMGNRVSPEAMDECLYQAHKIAKRAGFDLCYATGKRNGYVLVQ